jgi:hypothetical protein
MEWQTPAAALAVLAALAYVARRAARAWAGKAAGCGGCRCPGSPEGNTSALIAPEQLLAGRARSPRPLQPGAAGEGVAKAASRPHG